MPALHPRATHLVNSTRSPKFGSRSLRHGSSLYPRPKGIAITESDPNPYASPRDHADENIALESSTFLTPRRGPTMTIAIGALIGLMIGFVVFLKLLFPPGFLGFIPGAALGGLFYRFASASLPVDPKARRGRYTCAVVTVFLVPAIVGVLTYKYEEGVSITILTILLGIAFATGIVVAGDRRPNQE